LDVNARAWGFHALGPAAGVDFPYLLFADQMGYPVERARARAGVGWLRLVTDIPVALRDMLGGYMSPSEYFQSLRRTKVESVFSSGDPLPSALEFALFPYFVAKKLQKISR